MSFDTCFLACWLPALHETTASGPATYQLLQNYLLEEHVNLQGHSGQERCVCNPVGLSLGWGWGAGPDFAKALLPPSQRAPTAPSGRTVPRSVSVIMEPPVTQFGGPAPVPLASLETSVCRVSWKGPLTQPGGSPAQGMLLHRLSSAHPWAHPAVQREALPPRPPPLSSWLLPAECPLGWYGPGCQSPCKCEHQCPCDPQTGNCSLAWSRTLNSILSQGTAPPRLPGDSRGQTPPLPTFSLSLASCSEAVSPATRGHPAGRRTLPFHQVGAFLGAAAGVGGIPPPSAFEAWPLLRAWAGLGSGNWAPDDNSLI